MTAVVEAPSEDTRRPLDFNETLSQPMEPQVGGSFESDGKHPQFDSARGNQLSHWGTPQTTRKRAPPMSQARYADLRAMLIGRREQRDATHASMKRDTASCTAAAEAIERDALPRALCDWTESYEWLRTTVDRFPEVKSYLLSENGDSPVLLPKSDSAALQQGSPSAAAKSLRPVLDAIERMEVRRTELSNVQALERTLQLTRDRADLRLRGFDDERLALEQVLSTALTDVKAHRRRQEQLERELAELPSADMLDAEAVALRSAAAASLQVVEERQSALTASEAELEAQRSHLRCLSESFRELDAQTHDLMIENLWNLEEPQRRHSLECDEDSCRLLLLRKVADILIATEQCKADQLLEKHSTQLSELQRLTAAVAEGRESTAQERLQELKRERDYVVAEVRELNSSMSDIEQDIQDLVAAMPLTIDLADAQALSTAKANVQALELVLERRRDALAVASLAEEERRVIQHWLQSESSVGVPSLFAHVDGAHDVLVNYRTLSSQCVKLGNELSVVHAQQREQQEFTSLGLLHNLEDEVAQAADYILQLERDAEMLSAEVADLLSREKESCEERERLSAKEALALAEVDVLREEELQYTSEAALLRRKLRQLEDDARRFREEEASHQAERHRRYLRSLGVLDSNTSDMDDMPHEEIPPSKPHSARPNRSRQEVLSNPSTCITVSTLPQSRPWVEEAVPKPSRGPRWWWLWGSGDASSRGGTV